MQEYIFKQALQVIFYAHLNLQSNALQWSKNMGYGLWPRFEHQLCLLWSRIQGKFLNPSEFLFIHLQSGNNNNLQGCIGIKLDNMLNIIKKNVTPFPIEK